MSTLNHAEVRTPEALNGPILSFSNNPRCCPSFCEGLPCRDPSLIYTDVIFLATIPRSINHVGQVLGV